MIVTGENEMPEDGRSAAKSTQTEFSVATIDPYTYLVDVLQRIDSHLASEVHLLTPRLWKENYAERPMKSDLGREI